MSNRIFITGTGTGIGKTVVSTIMAEALCADYWKPVQAGYDEGTDSAWVRSMVSNIKTVIYDEVYKLKLPASPHIAARRENIRIDLQSIVKQMPPSDNLIIEGAGGLMVPLNDQEFIIDLIKLLNVKVVIVSRNELGSINHSLLTASVCRHHKIDVAGWVFNDSYLDYEDEIVQWSGFPRLASIRRTDVLNASFISEQAVSLRKQFNMFS